MVRCRPCGQTLGIINPATEEIMRDGLRQADRAKEAMEAAAKAMPAWMKLTSWDRAKVLKKTAELMANEPTIARALTMEQGKPLAEAKAEVSHRRYLRMVRRGRERAYGRIIPQRRTSPSAIMRSSTPSGSWGPSLPGISRPPC